MDLHARFLNGLSKYNIPENDIINYIYAGCVDDLDDIDKTNNVMIPNDKTEITGFCVCDTPIKRIKFIMRKDDVDRKLYITGSCCIKQFIPTGMNKTCSTCFAIHRNRKVDLCNGCRVDKKLKLKKKCKICQVIYRSKIFDECYDCREQIERNKNCKIFFGRYKNTLVKKLPPDYVRWCKNNSVMEHNDNFWKSMKYNFPKVFSP